MACPLHDALVVTNKTLPTIIDPAELAQVGGGYFMLGKTLQEMKGLAFGARKVAHPARNGILGHGASPGYFAASPFNVGQHGTTYFGFNGT